MIKDDFHTVCSWVQFSNKEAWKYDLFLGNREIKIRFCHVSGTMIGPITLLGHFILAKNPVPVRCPIAGKFMFHQKGDVLFETRILGGVTKSPRPNIYCKQNISDLSVCSTDQKEIAIDETYCLSVDHLGKPVDIYSESH